MFPRKKPTVDLVSADRPRRRLGIGGGPLVISLVLHGALVALGVGWILKVMPEPDDHVPTFTQRTGDQGRANTLPKKPRTASASFRDLSRVAAVGVTGSVVLPEPGSSGGMETLGALGGDSLAGGVESIERGGLGGIPGMEGPVNAGAMFRFDLRSQRVAYVIDFSQSMRADGRDGLMREELARSVAALPDRTNYQLIFFSGPAWVAGDEVKGNVVRHKGKEYRWSSKSLWEWAPEGPVMKVAWDEAGESQKRKSIEWIRETPLAGGTDWETPLKMAMAMEPPPEEIFFMTDGAMENRDMKRLVRGLVAEAKSRNIRINTVNMMVPQQDAVEAMNDLAERTGGVFTIVDKDGRIHRGRAK